jgi:hypothetical protein
MCVSNTASCTSWEAYATSKPWTLESATGGTKTVNVWFRDGLGNASPKPCSDTIDLNTYKGGQTVAPVISDPILPTIDTKNYKQGSFAREVDPAIQKMILKVASPNAGTIRQYPYPADNNLIFNLNEWGSVISMQADVSILESSIVNSGHTHASLWGIWYNDGTAGNGFIGDIFAEVAIRESSSGLTCRYRICRNTDMYGSRCENVAVEEFSTAISKGASYPLSIQYDQTITGSHFPRVRDAFLRSRRSSRGLGLPRFGQILGFGPGENADSSGFIKASFGNVLKNGAPYDSFTSVSINPLKWAYAEGIRDTQNGKLLSQVKSNAAYAGIPLIHSTVDIAYPNRINLLKTKVTPLTYENTKKVKVGARIYGYFYNSGTIGLLEEGSHLNDVGAEVGVGGDGLSPAGMWRVWRSTDTSGTAQEELASGI